ncbi:hypothetical protein F5146DRAFT_1006724 [Armillaria mellea]|nr:hypothetical protein F5146DRAFT_1006724 [Armillaria mellea]
MNFNLPSSLCNCPFADALRVFGYCISHPAESNDSAMHTDAWVLEAFVAWESLNRSWLMEEPGFILDQVWADMQMYLWFAVDDLDQSQVCHSIWEFNLLVAEAFKSDVVVAPLVLDMPSPTVHPSPLLLLTPHHAGPWRMPSNDHSLPATSPDIFSPVAGPSQPIHVLSAIEDDAEDLEPAQNLSKTLHWAPSETAQGYGSQANQAWDLRPIGLVVSDKDFGDFFGCKGAFFKRSVAHKVGHFLLLQKSMVFSTNFTAKHIK